MLVRPTFIISRKGIANHDTHTDIDDRARWRVCSLDLGRLCAAGREKGRDEAVRGFPERREGAEEAGTDGTERRKGAEEAGIDGTERREGTEETRAHRAER